VAVLKKRNCKTIGLDRVCKRNESENGLPTNEVSNVA
jgi:hypothetical protein